MEAHEAHENIEEAFRDKRVAILIAVLAAALAITDGSGKSAQHEAVERHIEASDTWAFYQAKNIRATMAQDTAAMLDALATSVPPAQADGLRSRAQAMHAEAARLDKGQGTEGKEQLAALAHEAEAKHVQALAAARNFELGAGALQIAIVLASASIITGVGVLLLGAGGLGLIGTALCFLGWFAPTLLPFP